MSKLIRILAVIGIITVLLIPISVFAIGNPDTQPLLNSAYVFNNVLEEGDCGILMDYFIDYTISGNPTESATEAYMAIFIDTDGTTQLRGVAPYAFDDDGYGRGNMWIYFTAAEVTTYGIDSANEALYEIWLMGNPTVESGWPGDPPKTIGAITNWITLGDPSVLVAQQVKNNAALLGIAWTVAMIEQTAEGTRLTTTYGEPYYQNVIPNLRSIAPACFASGTVVPTIEDIDYTTTFGAVMADGTGTLGAGSPLVLAEGANTVNIAVGGTFTIELERGTVGTVASIAGGGVVTGSPVDINFGTNTITSTAAGTGNILVTVNLVNTQTVITDTIEGTGLDLTELATRFGMSRLWFSGIVWLIISVIICASGYRVGSQGSFGGSGKVTMVLFDICIIGGAVLGMLSMIVAILLFIGFGVFTGFVLFYKPSNL